MHRQGDGPQHLAVEIAEVRSRAGRYRGACRSPSPNRSMAQADSRVPGSSSPFQLAARSLGHGLRSPSRSRSSGWSRLPPPCPRRPPVGAVLGRGRHRVALRAGQRMNMKDRGTAAHDLDRLPVRIVDATRNRRARSRHPAERRADRSRCRRPATTRHGRPRQGHSRAYRRPSYRLPGAGDRQTAP